MAAKAGDKVKIEYTGTLDDGTVFDSSERAGQPLEFELGAGHVIKGFDTHVTGMEVDQEKEFRLESSEAYGDVNPAMVKEIPRDRLPKEPEPKEGMVLVMSSPQGHQIPAKIKEVKEKSVMLDLNPPLAGKALTFKVKLVSIN